MTPHIKCQRCRDTGWYQSKQRVRQMSDCGWETNLTMKPCNSYRSCMQFRERMSFLEIGRARVRIEEATP